jgi:multimeric flavodoxin WrbA
MNILILNGAPGGELGAASRAIAAAVERAARAKGWTAAAFDLDGLDIKPCRGCFACWLKHSGTCAIKDDEDAILKAWASTDVLAWTTPVVFGGYGPALKKALDRAIPNILPFFIKVHGEVHHPQRYEGRRSLLAFGTLPSPDAEAERIFHGLVQRNALNLGSVRTESRVFHGGVSEAAAAGPAREMLEAAEEVL